MSHHPIATITVNIDSLTSPCEQLIQVLQIPYIRGPINRQAPKARPAVLSTHDQDSWLQTRAGAYTESNTSEEAESTKGRAELKIKNRAEQERPIVLRCQFLQAPGPAVDAEYICCIIAAYTQHHVYGPFFPFFCQPVRARCFVHHNPKLENFKDMH